MSPKPQDTSSPATARTERVEHAAAAVPTPSSMDRLRSLVNRALGSDVASQALGECDRLQERLEITSAEAEGLGHELLRAYEHLGIVFQLTRQVSGLSTEEEVLSAFQATIQSAYPADLVTLVFPASTDSPPTSKLVGYSGAAAQRCRIERQAIVEDVPAGSPGETLQLISAPIFCGDDFVCAIQMARTRHADGVSRSTDSVGRHGSLTMAPFDSADMLLLESLAAFCGDLLRNHRLVEALRQASVDTVRALVSAVDQKDPYTSGHSNRVGYYATLLGTALGLGGRELQMLHWSALLHDVGKIGIRDSVLNKLGRLTSEEMDHMKEHPRRGYEVVRQIPHFSESLDGVLYHHEHYDGKGYPDGLVGEAIPLQARIIQIADVFDALTSSRSYRSAFTWEKALTIMREEAGTTLDPVLANRFDQLLRSLHIRHPDRFTQIGRGAGIPDLEGRTGTSHLSAGALFVNGLHCGAVAHPRGPTSDHQNKAGR